MLNYTETKVSLLPLSESKITMNLHGKLNFNVGLFGQLSLTKCYRATDSLKSLSDLQNIYSKRSHWIQIINQNYLCCLGGHHHPISPQGEPPEVLASLPPPYPQTAED